MADLGHRYIDHLLWLAENADAAQLTPDQRAALELEIAAHTGDAQCSSAT